jgi:hypothetical protein
MITNDTIHKPSKLRHHSDQPTMSFSSTSAAHPETVYYPKTTINLEVRQPMSTTTHYIQGTPPHHTPLYFIPTSLQLPKTSAPSMFRASTVISNPINANLAEISPKS